ncbi:polyketide cyclase [Aeromicrobium sp. Root495]|uniref:nuclear transport factor 2 family protein n=1 Tax=Aeromicrobium sp. Root495 TaxID=1736550 RepID=UPI0006F311A8|nr:nuclear transport factor 2 family protein [Aeromicrobium sp. Root495]KQY59769.1 polyketide cyclase [Aeromicrobium sp. Root495]RYJ04759.1 MAG: nuclear transport factor 2 family protein [Actinomycetales bacterium]
MTRPAAVEAWHAIAASQDPAGLKNLLADDAVFRSPAVFTPQEGKAITTAYLSAAIVVLGPTLTYHRELVTGDSAMLEFTCELDGVQVHGIDLLRWNDDDQVVEFTVMVRPFKALEALVKHMGAELQRAHG